ncbi:MAG: putative quinol monooxygenase [Acidimicrobiales bacterium]
MLIISGSLSFAPEDRKLVLENLVEITQLSRNDAGCVDYWWAEDVEEPNTFRFFECWESQELFDAHISTPHEKTFGERLLSRIAGATAQTFSAAPQP